jgi:hypothetical protein
MSDDQDQADEPGHSDEASPAVRVECYAGYRAGESPRRFFIGKREVRVVEIIDRWLDPASSHFKVRGDDDGIYILRYSQDADCWEMILFNSGTRDDIRLSST